MHIAYIILLLMLAGLIAGLIFDPSRALVISAALAMVALAYALSLPSWSLATGYLIVFGFPAAIGIPGIGIAASAALRSGKKWVALGLLFILPACFAIASLGNAYHEYSQTQAIKFVRTHPAVVRLAGDNASVYPDSTSAGINTRYEFSVVVGSKFIFPVIEKSVFPWRELALICISTKEPGQRDPFRDTCSQ